MPRGNDSTAAAVDLRGQYGVDANAEQLIRQHRLSVTKQARTAMNLERIPDAVDDDLTQKVQEKVGDAGAVLDVAVRGHLVVAVVEADSGRAYKMTWPREEFGGPKSRRKFDTETDDEKAEREEAAAALVSYGHAAEAEKAAQAAAEEARRKKLEELSKLEAPKAKADDDSK